MVSILLCLKRSFKYNFLKKFHQFIENEGMTKFIENEGMTEFCQKPIDFRLRANFRR